MTSNGDRSGGTVPLRADGIALDRLAEVAAAGGTVRQSSDRRLFWASGLMGIGSGRAEVMEVSFGAERLVNHLSFKISRFPLNLRVEYLSGDGEWLPITYPTTRRTNHGHVRTIRRQPVNITISQSVPSRVNSAQQQGHPQHFGQSHWAEYSLKINPINTRQIRFRFTRSVIGDPPTNANGDRVNYSVAMKDLALGYRVTSKSDVPRLTAAEEESGWASGGDILGSPTLYATYEQPPGRAVDGSLLTYWRSEPQPFSFAVVNFHLDLRGPDGSAPVIDRFWVDPITTGVHCNVYYSNSAPDGDFDGVSDPLPSDRTILIGNPIPVRDPATLTATGLNLGPVTKTGVEVNNAYLQLRYDKPWWVGIDMHTLADVSDGTSHPLISLGTTQIVQDGATLKVLAQSGSQAAIDLDPALHTFNARSRLVVSYHPEDPNRPPYFRITYQLGGYDSTSSESAIVSLTESSSPVRVGLHPDPANLDIPAATIKALVVKSEVLTPEIEEWFLDEGPAYVADPVNDHEDRGTARNARLRMHPMFISENNLFGVVGGPGDRYDDMVWTPINRDYVLRQGYMHLPPTKAAYWKFEMSGLIPQVYENFLTIDRDVSVFPEDVVAAHNRVSGGMTSRTAPAGVETMVNQIDTVAYSDALDAIRAAPPTPQDATKVLVVKDPVQAQRVAETGWVWTYQPWHIGSRSPQFIGTRKHQYQSLSVRHSTKVAFFAGLREITPMRVDYTFDDDTPEYVEHLLDTAFLDLDQTSAVRFVEGGLSSTASYAEVTSKALPSYRTVRGVQFASQETDSVQVLPDPDFSAEHLDLWEEYGDATMRRLGPSALQIVRGWFFYTYGDLEQKYLSYSEMDGVLYSRLEGANMPSGSAEGGVTSVHYSPSGAGKVLAVVTLSAGEVSAPITAEIVSVYDNRVLATQTEWPRVGETLTMRLGYTPGALTEFRTYGDIETLVSSPTTYAELEAFRYFELESDREVNTDLYVRVRQRGQTDDTFVIHRIGLYDSPVAWFFSNDDGATWWQAIDVRSNPHGVLVFPESLTPEVPGTGRTLRWKARIYRENAVVNALHIRPWYGTRSKTSSSAYGLDSVGPNKSGWDHYPTVSQHPMWSDRFNPIEHVYEEPVRVEPFWRNLVINPSGERDDTPGSWEATGGTYEIVTPGGGA